MNFPPLIRALLWPLSLIYGSVVRLRAWLYAHQWLKQKRLKGVVVSVGNITTGGTGKTPVTIELLREFRGSKAGLLTRGHGRTARENVLYFDTNENMPRSLTGDEAQLCMRAAGVPSRAE